MNPDVLRIAIFGPESTGKSELATKLGARFQAPVVAEYAREFWDAHGVITLEDMVPIAREQWRREDEAVARVAAELSRTCNLLGYTSAGNAEGAAENCNLIGYTRGARAPLVVCDTEALTTMLWSDLLYGTTPDEVRRGAEKRCRNYALYLLLDTDVAWAPDPQRCFPDPEDREKCRRIWHGALERRQLPYVWIRGDWAERERAAIAAMESVLRSAGEGGRASR
ncbi:MAG: ATP-binding protein [Opitutae bacterium]|nr:ATP-binding protein [Opitutae bacterium]